MQTSDIFSIIAVAVTLIGIWRQWKRDKASIIIDNATAKKTDAEIEAFLDLRAAEWLKRQEDKIIKQDTRIAEQEKRIEELEKRDTERREKERQLQQYIEYLLDGIRVLIRQTLDAGQMPKFDPVSLDDFVIGIDN